MFTSNKKKAELALANNAGCISNAARITRSFAAISAEITGGTGMAKEKKSQQRELPVKIVFPAKSNAALCVEQKPRILDWPQNLVPLVEGFLSACTIGITSLQLAMADRMSKLTYVGSAGFVIWQEAI